MMIDERKEKTAERLWGGKKKKKKKKKEKEAKAVGWKIN
jgi:hypothetical protein